VLLKLPEKQAEKVPRLSTLARILSENPELRHAYAPLYAGMRLNDCSGSGKSILVTSTQPNEGKTTVACSLAITASLAGQTLC
jgi:Mrp family chromosome partitioning ATPase